MRRDDERNDGREIEPVEREMRSSGLKMIGAGVEMIDSVRSVNPSGNENEAEENRNSIGLKYVVAEQGHSTKLVV